ncbi:nucleotide-diphospho-sugar transferases superfamily protein [Wolffia australiana]
MNRAASLWFLLLLAVDGVDRVVSTEDYDRICDAGDFPDPIDLRSDQLTVLLNGYSEARLPLLRSLAVSYASLPFVAAVIVIWGNPSVPSARLAIPTVHRPGATPISVVLHRTISLNARFLPRREITTRAVAVCDDDVIVDAASVRFAFDVWSTHRRRIVGFFARSHDLTPRGWIYTVHPARYSILLTKFMVLGTEYLFRYSCGGGEGMKKARGVVEEARNCEDILMNFVAAMETGSGPLMVGGDRIRDLGDVRNDGSEKMGAVGLSALIDHRKRRGECITEFHRTLGVMPLRYGFGKMVKDVGEQALCRKGGKLVLCDAQ